MKEATGDMTMTIVVIVGIVFVLGLATRVIWPKIQERIEGEIGGISTEVDDDDDDDDGALGGGYIKLPDYYNN